MTLTTPDPLTESGMSHSRRLARLAAVQALYQLEISRSGVKAVIDEFERYRFNDTAGCARGEGIYAGHVPQSADRVFFADILEGVIAAQAKIDRLIAYNLAQGWTLLRLDSIARAILRAAIYELLARVDIPVKVTLDEYIEIANSFFDMDTAEPKFINGILDAIAQQGRGEEL